MGETYFFVPLQYETELAEEIDLAIAGDKTTIVQIGNFIEGNSTVRNRDVLGRVTNIPNSIINSFTNETKSLIGFCIKGFVERDMPDIYQKFWAMQGCFGTTNSRDYLDYINTLINGDI